MSSTEHVGVLLICDLLREELLKFKSKKTKKRRLWRLGGLENGF